MFLTHFSTVALGIIFYQNEDGDVLDIQADIIGPGKCRLRRSEASVKQN